MICGVDMVGGQPSAKSMLTYFGSQEQLVLAIRCLSHWIGGQGLVVRSTDIPRLEASQCLIEEAAIQSSSRQVSSLCFEY